MFWENKLLCEYSEVRKFNLREYENFGFIRKYSKNKSIEFNKNEDIILIVSGRIKIYTTNENGNEKILYILSTGDLVGEIDFYSVTNHDYEVATLGETVIRIVSKSVIERKIEQNPKVYENIIKSIIRKYQIVTSQLTDNVFMDSNGKIASILLRLAEQEGKIVGEHVEYFYIKQQDIANLLGCSRVTISKSLNKFKCEGIINIKDNKIIIIDKEKLEEYTNVNI